MEFTMYQDRFGNPYWFSGIYKITQYEYYGAPCRPMPKGEYCYQCYVPICKAWGNYVDRTIQSKNEPLTFEQCVKLCEQHEKDNPPDKYQLKDAEIARERFLS